jgi:hypothetical protein
MWSNLTPKLPSSLGHVLDAVGTSHTLVPTTKLHGVKSHITVKFLCTPRRRGNRKRRVVICIPRPFYHRGNNFCYLSNTRLGGKQGQFVRFGEQTKHAGNRTAFRQSSRPWPSSYKNSAMPLGHGFKIGYVFLASPLLPHFSRNDWQPTTTSAYQQPSSLLQAIRYTPYLRRRTAPFLWSTPKT